MKTCSRGHGEYSSRECQLCHRARTKAWKKANRRKTRDSNQKWYEGFRARHPGHHQVKTLKSQVKRQYGMTLEQYYEFLKSTGGICELCRKPNKKLVVDHNHETGKVRGVLCGKCNTSLGLLDDSISRAMAAIAYWNERGSYGR